MVVRPTPGWQGWRVSMPAPAVSVILPTFNRKVLLPVSAGSVLAQSFRDLELIVVDDGSDENIEEVVAGFNDPRVRYIRRTISGGPAAARNTGLKAARGNYIAFQDSDDEWMLDKLAIQMSSMEKRPTGAMCVGSLVRRFGNALRVYRGVGPGVNRVEQTSEVVANPVAYTQTWLVPRDVIVDVGGFNEELRVWEDWELMLRLTNRLDILSTPESLVYSVRLGDSVSTNREVFLKSITLIDILHAETFSQFPKQSARLRYLWGRRLIADGRTEQARTMLLTAIKSDPGRLRPWILWLTTILQFKFVLRRLQRAQE